MNTLFEKNGGKYEMQGDYRLPCVALPQDTTEEILKRLKRLSKNNSKGKVDLRSN